MTKTILLAAVVAVAILGLTTASIAFNNTAEATEDSDERVSVTVNLDDRLKTDEVMVLLDTTGTGTLSIVHVAANLPCNITGDGKPTFGPANDEPGVFVFAGEATGVLTPLIFDDSSDTGFEGSDDTCVYHASIDEGGVPGVITDVIIIHPDNHPDAKNNEIKKHETLKGVVTVTGTYN